MIDEKELEPSAGLSGLTIFGWACTILWILIVVGLASILEDEFLYLDLNELGDFLAGLVAPIAFLWFVIAFYQQKTELKQNSAALRLQAREMKLAVEQASNQAAAQALSATIARTKTILDIHQEAEREIRASVLDVVEALRANNLSEGIANIISQKSMGALLESRSMTIPLRYIGDQLDAFLDTKHFGKLVTEMCAEPARRSFFLDSMKRYTGAIGLWQTRLGELAADESEMLMATRGEHIEVSKKILKLYVKIENAIGDGYGKI